MRLCISKRFIICQVLQEWFLGSPRSQNVRLFFFFFVELLSLSSLKSQWDTQTPPKTNDSESSAKSYAKLPHFQGGLVSLTSLEPSPWNSMPPKRCWDCPVTPTSVVKNTSTQDYPPMATTVLIRGLSLGRHTFLLTNGLFIIIVSTIINLQELKTTDQTLGWCL